MFRDAYARRELARWLAGALLWLLLAACFVFSVRGANLSARAVAYMRGNAVTPAEEGERRLAAETARAFAAEWATFDADDRQGYAERLAVFGFASPPLDFNGVQECRGASVAGLEAVPGERGVYRVRVLLRLARLVEGEPGAGVPAASRVLTERDAAWAADPRGERPRPVFWKGGVACVQVTVKVKDGKAEILGTPVLVPSPGTTGRSAAEASGGESPPEGFEVFARQALEFYFAGRDMANFTAPGARVPPLGGYRLEGARVLSYRPAGDGAVAVVLVQVSAPGLEKWSQEVVLDVTQRDGRWLVRRIGSL